jgi:hypothetical protein
MRTIAIAVGLLLLGTVTTTAQVDPDTLDLKDIFNAADSIMDVPVVDTIPTIINCPQYDPDRVRGDASTFSFESRPELESTGGLVEFLLEFVVGKDGKVERGRTRVIRTNTPQLERQFPYWVQTCSFKPGKIGEHEVRVRMEHEWRYQINR